MSSNRFPRRTDARLQRERRFLLPSLPRSLAVGSAWLVEERYLAGTGLTLRRCISPRAFATGVPPVLTLGQQIRTASDRSARFTLVDRLHPAEYQTLARLPAEVLVWRRYDVTLSGYPANVDVFEGDLHGLVLAQASFDSPVEAAEFQQPVYAVAEVTGDPRFGEHSLARTNAMWLSRLLAEYGVLIR